MSGGKRFEPNGQVGGQDGGDDPPVLDGPRCRTLVVEDDRQSKEALVALLERAGYEVKAVESLGAAFGTFIKWRPRCVVLDLMLPDGNGIEFLRTVRFHEIPVSVAVLSAANDPKLLSEVRDLTPGAYFSKPLELPALLEWLGRESVVPAAPAPAGQ